MGLDAIDPNPTQEQLVFVRAYIQSLSRQGLTDVISVSGPKVKEIEYDVRVWLYPGSAPDQALAKITDNLNKLFDDQYWLGHDHSHTAIHAVCALSGVHHVDIDEPHRRRDRPARLAD